MAAGEIDGGKVIHAELAHVVQDHQRAVGPCHHDGSFDLGGRYHGGDVSGPHGGLIVGLRKPGLARCGMAAQIEGDQEEVFRQIGVQLPDEAVMTLPDAVHEQDGW